MSAPAGDRRAFLKRSVMGGCGIALGAYTVRELITQGPQAGLRIGFPGDAPAALGPHAREASWYRVDGSVVSCELCPHRCVLRENDRGFCRTRVVRDGKLHTLAYGNPCAVHLDPVEKKPLHHFLPGTSILSMATAGCNLRCLNCQNWEISQARPDDTRNVDLPPERAVAAAAARGIPSLAYTYSEPLVWYEYMRDTAIRARERGLRNVLVSAGYGEEAPLRELCRVLDAANMDLKGFRDRFYRKVTGARRDPVLHGLEVMREEGVWIEITRLLVPEYADDLEDIRAMCGWIARRLGTEVPLHLSRFHPAYRLERLPPTPLDRLDQAREIAREEGLSFVYIGNAPGHGFQDTLCPRCGSAVIERRGYEILANRLEQGRCPCGEAIAGVWT